MSIPSFLEGVLTEADFVSGDGETTSSPPGKVVIPFVDGPLEFDRYVPEPEPTYVPKKRKSATEYPDWFNPDGSFGPSQLAAQGGLPEWQIAKNTMADTGMSAKEYDVYKKAQEAADFLPGDLKQINNVLRGVRRGGLKAAEALNWLNQTTDSLINTPLNAIPGMEVEGSDEAMQQRRRGYDAAKAELRREIAVTNLTDAIDQRDDNEVVQAVKSGLSSLAEFATVGMATPGGPYAYVGGVSTRDRYLGNIDRGMEKPAALGNAFGKSAIEMVLMAITGKLFGKGAEGIGQVDDSIMAKLLAPRFKEMSTAIAAPLKTLGQGMSEATEEVLTEFGQYYVDKVSGQITPEEEQNFWRNVRVAGMAGLFAGSGASVPNAIAEIADSYQKTVAAAEQDIDRTTAAIEAVAAYDGNLDLTTRRNFESVTGMKGTSKQQRQEIINAAKESATPETIDAPEQTIEQPVAEAAPVTPEQAAAVEPAVPQQQRLTHERDVLQAEADRLSSKSVVVNERIHNILRELSAIRNDAAEELDALDESDTAPDQGPPGKDYVSVDLDSDDLPLNLDDLDLDFDDAPQTPRQLSPREQELESRLADARRELYETDILKERAQQNLQKKQKQLDAETKRLGRKRPRSQVAPEQAAAVRPEVQAEQAAPTLQGKEDIVRAVQAAIPGSVAEATDTGMRIGLPNGQFLTLESVPDVAAYVDEASIKSNLEAYKMEDTPENRAKLLNDPNGSFVLTTKDGEKISGLGIIRLAHRLNTAPKRMRRTVRHELFHAGHQLGFITDQEFDALRKKYAPDAKTVYEAEETLADAAELWEGDRGLTAYLKEMFDRLLAALGFKELSWQTAQNAVARGDVFTRRGKNLDQARKDVKTSLTTALSAGELDARSTQRGTDTWEPPVKLTPQERVVNDYYDADSGRYLWEMSSDEVWDLRDKSKDYENSEVKLAFGDRATEYRRANAAKKEQMEDELTHDRLDILYGWTNPHPPSDVIDNFSRAMSDGSWETPEQTAQFLAYKVADLPDSPDPKTWSSDNILAAATFRQAKEEIARNSWDGQDITRMLLEKMASRYSDPSDLEMMTAKLRQGMQAFGSGSQQTNAGLLPPTALSAKRDLPDRYLDRANVSTDPQARRAMSEADVEHGPPAHRAREVAAAEATRRLEQDYDGELNKFLADIEKAEKQGTVIPLDVADTVTLRRLLSDLGLKMMQGDKEARRLHRTLNRGYRDARSVQASALSLRDPLLDPNQTPHERRRNAIEQAMAEDTKDLKKKRKKKGSTEDVEAEADQRFDELLKWLTDHGWDLSDIDKIAADPEETIRLIKDIKTQNSGITDVLYEFWKNGILSGPQTHIVNSIGNTAYSTWEMSVERAGEAVINMFVKDPKGAQLGEFKYLLRGIGPGLFRGARNAMKAWRTESASFQVEMMRAETEFEQGTTGAIPGKAGRVIRIPYRMLMFADEFAKSLTATMEVGAQAYRLGKAQGLKGVALENFIAEQTNDIQSQSWDLAIDKSVQLAFQGEGGVASQIIQKTGRSVRQVPGMRWLIPFLTTPANIFETGLRRTPILGLMLDYADARHRGHKMTDSGVSATLARQAIAIAGLMILMSLNDPDDPWITGAKDMLDPKKRDIAYRRAPPMSIKLFDQWYSYARIEPFATAIGFTVDMVNSDKEGDALIGSLRGGLAQTVDKTYLQSLGDLQQAYEVLKREGTLDGVAEWSSNFAASWVWNIVRQTSRNAREEMAERRVWGKEEEYWDRLLRRTAQKTELRVIPDMARYDVWGRPIPQHPSSGAATDLFYRLISPIKTMPEDKVLDVDKALYRWNAKNPDSVEGFMPIQPYFRQNGETHYLTDEEYAEYARMAGEFAFKRLQRVRFNVDDPTERQIEAIVETVRQGRADARKVLKPKWNRSR